MTCPTCAQMCATSEEQLALRQRNMAAMPDATPAPCPSCGSIEWATTREMIKAEPKKRWWQWRPPLPSWQVIRALNFIGAGICAMLAVTPGNEWVRLVDAFLAGWLLSHGFNANLGIRMQRSFDCMREAFEEMREVNDALINNRVMMHFTGTRRDDDYPPIAPKLH